MILSNIMGTELFLIIDLIQLHFTSTQHFRAGEDAIHRKICRLLSGEKDLIKYIFWVAVRKLLRGIVQCPSHQLFIP